MKDLLLAENGDLAIVNNDLAITNDKQSLAQKIKVALKTIEGEYFYNSSIGVPYFSEILGQNNAIDTIRAIMIDYISKIEGVKELTDFNLSLDSRTRVLNMKFTVTDEENNILQIET